LIFLVGRAGFEPATTALKVHCQCDEKQRKATKNNDLKRCRQQ
jgi:hypothetical protein